MADNSPDKFRVIDADTVDDGNERLRFAGGNAPELSTRAGQSARAFTDSVVQDYTAVERRGYGHYGRTIAELRNPETGESLNERQIRNGVMSPVDYSRSGEAYRFRPAAAANTLLDARREDTRPEFARREGDSTSADAIARHARSKPRAPRTLLQEFGASMGTSIQNLQGSYGAMLAAVGDLVADNDDGREPLAIKPGDQTVRDRLTNWMQRKGMNIYQRNLDEAAAYNYERTSFEDVLDDPGKAFRWAFGVLGEALPSVFDTALGAAAGGGIGAATKATLKKAALNRFNGAMRKKLLGVGMGPDRAGRIAERVTQRFASRIGPVGTAAESAVTGARVGAASVAGAQIGGQTYTNIFNEYGVRAPGAAIAAGAVGGALEVVGLETILRRFFADTGAARGILQTAVRTAGLGAAVEGTTEGAQEFVQAVAEETSRPDWDGSIEQLSERLTSRDRQMQYMEAVAAGALFGSMFGGAGGATSAAIGQLQTREQGAGAAVAQPQQPQGSVQAPATGQNQSASAAAGGGGGAGGGAGGGGGAVAGASATGSTTASPAAPGQPQSPAAPVQAGAGGAGQVAVPSTSTILNRLPGSGSPPQTPPGPPPGSPQGPPPVPGSGAPGGARPVVPPGDQPPGTPPGTPPGVPARAAGQGLGSSVVPGGIDNADIVQQNDAAGVTTDPALRPPGIPPDQRLLAGKRPPPEGDPLLPGSDTPRPEGGPGGSPGTSDTGLVPPDGARPTAQTLLDRLNPPVTPASPAGPVTPDGTGSPPVESGAAAPGPAGTTASSTPTPAAASSDPVASSSADSVAPEQAFQALLTTRLTAPPLKLGANEYSRLTPSDLEANTEYQRRLLAFLQRPDITDHQRDVVTAHYHASESNAQEAQQILRIRGRGVDYEDIGADRHILASQTPDAPLYRHGSYRVEAIRFDWGSKFIEFEVTNPKGAVRSLRFRLKRDPNAPILSGLEAGVRARRVVNGVMEGGTTGQLIALDAPELREILGPQVLEVLRSLRVNAEGTGDKHRMAEQFAALATASTPTPAAASSDPAASSSADGVAPDPAVGVSKEGRTEEELLAMQEDLEAAKAETTRLLADAEKGLDVGVSLGDLQHDLRELEALEARLADDYLSIPGVREREEAAAARTAESQRIGEENRRKFEEDIAAKKRAEQDSLLATAASRQAAEDAIIAEFGDTAKVRRVAKLIVAKRRRRLAVQQSMLHRREGGKDAERAIRRKQALMQTLQAEITALRAELAGDKPPAAPAAPVNIWYGSGENARLSNLSTDGRGYVSTRDNRRYVSVEHEYQANKSGSFDQGVYQAYLRPGAARKIAGRKGTNTKNNANFELMKAAMLDSFRQNPEAAAELLATGDRPLTHTQEKSVWREVFPRLLSEVRTELRAELGGRSTPTPTPEPTPEPQGAIAAPTLNWIADQLDAKRPYKTLVAQLVKRLRAKDPNVTAAANWAVARRPDQRTIKPDAWYRRATVLVEEAGKLKGEGERLSPEERVRLHAAAEAAREVTGREVEARRETSQTGEDTSDADAASPVEDEANQNLYEEAVDLNEQGRASLDRIVENLTRAVKWVRTTPAKDDAPQRYESFEWDPSRNTRTEDRADSFTTLDTAMQGAEVDADGWALVPLEVDPTADLFDTLPRNLQVSLLDTAYRHQQAGVDSTFTLKLKRLDTPDGVRYVAKVDEVIPYLDGPQLMTDPTSRESAIASDVVEEELSRIRLGKSAKAHELSFAASVRRNAPGVRQMVDAIEAYADNAEAAASLEEQPGWPALWAYAKRQLEVSTKLEDTLASMRKSLADPNTPPDLVSANGSVRLSSYGLVRMGRRMIGNLEGGTTNTLTLEDFLSIGLSVVANREAPLQLRLPQHARDPKLKLSYDATMADALDKLRKGAELADAVREAEAAMFAAMGTNAKAYYEAKRNLDDAVALYNKIVGAVGNRTNRAKTSGFEDPASENQRSGTIEEPPDGLNSGLNEGERIPLESHYWNSAALVPSTVNQRPGTAEVRGAEPARRTQARGPTLPPFVSRLHAVLRRDHGGERLNDRDSFTGKVLGPVARILGLQGLPVTVTYADASALTNMARIAREGGRSDIAEELDRRIQAAGNGGRVESFVLFAEDSAFIFIDKTLRGDAKTASRELKAKMFHELGHVFLHARLGQTSQNNQKLWEAVVAAAGDEAPAEWAANQLLGWAEGKAPRTRVESFIGGLWRLMARAARMMGLVGKTSKLENVMHQIFSAVAYGEMQRSAPAPMGLLFMKSKRDVLDLSVVNGLMRNDPVTVARFESAAPAFVAARRDAVGKKINSDALNVLDLLVGPNGLKAPVLRTEGFIAENWTPPMYDTLRRTAAGNAVAGIGNTLGDTAVFLHRRLTQTADRGLRSMATSDGRPLLASRALADLFRADPGVARQNLKVGGINIDFTASRWREGFFPAMRRVHGTLVEDRLYKILQTIPGKGAAREAQLEQARQELITGQVRSPEARALQTWFEEMWTYSQSHIPLLGKIQTNYFPRMYDIDKLHAQRGEFIQLLVRHQVKPDNAEEVWQKLVDGGGLQDLAQLRSVLAPLSGSRAHRGDVLRNIPDAELLPFMTDQVEGALYHYAHQMIKRAEFERAMGGWRVVKANTVLSPDSVQNWREVQSVTKAGTHHEVLVNGKWIKAYWDHLAIYDTIRNAALAEGAEPYQLERMDQTVHAYLGRGGQDLNPGARTMISITLTWINYLLLPLSLFSSMVDAGNPILRSNGGMKAAWTGMRAAVRAWKEKDKSMLYRMAVVNGMVANSRYTQIMNNYYDSPWLTGKSANWNETLFRYNGMHWWTNFSRTYALATGIEWFKDLAAKNDAESQRLLGEFNLDAATVKRWVAGGAKPYIEGQQGAELEKQVQDALNRFVYESILSPDASQRPVWASSPALVLFWHLKQFAWSFHDIILRRMWKEFQKSPTAKRKALIAVMPFIVLMPLAMFSTMLRDMLRYGLPWQDERPDWNENTGLEYYWHMADRAGLLGPAQIGLSAWESAEWGGNFVFSLMGPTVEHILVNPYRMSWEQWVSRSIPPLPVFPTERDGVRDFLSGE